MKQKQKSIKESKLFSYISRGTSPIQAVAYTAECMEQKGFTALSMEERWNLEPKGKYYVKLSDTGIAAFTLPGQMEEQKFLRELHVAVAHTDSPCFKVKSNPDIKGAGGCLQINTEPYGGMIMYSWFDRPLSLAGQVMVWNEESNCYESHLIDFSRPILTIPSLCIHQNRDVNNGINLNPQKDMIPIIGIGSETSDIYEILARELCVSKEKIGAFDLYLYLCELPVCCGVDGQMILAPRLDNLASCCALIEALQNQAADGINLISLFDNEEVGSQSKQGADSVILSLILEKLALALGMNREEYIGFVMGGRMLSVDAAHGTHPNYPDRSDPTNPISLDSGVVLKLSASQKYATDLQMLGEIETLCRQQEIPYVMFHNHSNIRGGSTIGSMTSSYLPMKTMDIGIPMLAMHSSAELIHQKGYDALEKLLIAYFS